MFYICSKFHENISKVFRVIERTRNRAGRTDGWVDRQTDGQGDYYRAFADFMLVLCIWSNSALYLYKVS